MRVSALAVRVAGVIVSVAVPGGHEPFDENLKVIDQGALEFVDEQGAGRVEGIDQGDARVDGELTDRVLHDLRDVRELGPLYAR
jgi:hypothetical protein